LEAGVKTSLSTDHTTSISVDPSASMRILFALDLHRMGGSVPLTLKRLLQLPTVDGAVHLGLTDHTGSIAPGKRADLVLIRTTGVNIARAPSDLYEAIVSLAMPGNVDTVIVDGHVLRRAGRFVGADHGKVVADARVAATGLRDRAKCHGGSCGTAGTGVANDTPLRFRWQTDGPDPLDWAGDPLVQRKVQVGVTIHGKTETL